MGSTCTSNYIDSPYSTNECLRHQNLRDLVLKPVSVLNCQHKPDVKNDATTFSVSNCSTPPDEIRRDDAHVRPSDVINWQPLRLKTVSVLSLLGVNFYELL